MDTVRALSEAQDEQLPVSLLAQLEPHRFTHAEYQAMGEAGILLPEARVELIEGIIVQMPPIGDWHSGTVRRLNNHAARYIGEAADIDVQNAIVLKNSEPEPDLVVVKPNLPGKPEANDVFLVVEVSETTLKLDQTVKKRIYASAGIPEYWVIDHPNDQIHQYTKPKGDTYEQERHWNRGETISSTISPTLTLSVDLILGDPTEQPANE